jgi:hypothetical protein
MARLRIQEVQPVQEMLERESKMIEGKIFVSNLRLVPDSDNDFQEFKRKISGKKESDFWEGENGMLYFRE